MSVAYVELRARGHHLRWVGGALVPQPALPPDLRALAAPHKPAVRQAWWQDPRCDLCEQLLAGCTADGRFLCATHGAGEYMGREAHNTESDNTMPKYNVTEPTFNLPEIGWHDAYLSKVVEEQVQREGETVDVLVWNFELNGGDTTVRTFSSTSFSKRSKAYGWASALLEVDDEVDTDDLADLPCRVKIIHKPSRQDPERIFANVDEVRAPAPVAKADKPKRREAPQPVAVGVADDDEAPF